MVTGSANYSKNSSQKNDENMLVIHKDSRIADMYLGEFHRIYEHYRARWALNPAKDPGKARPRELRLSEDSSWAKKYYNEDDQSARFVKVLLG